MNVIAEDFPVELAGEPVEADLRGNATTAIASVQGWRHGAGRFGETFTGYPTMPACDFPVAEGS
jgi:hypothetical protein